jgi:hypothetical protein
MLDADDAVGSDDEEVGRRGFFVHDRPIRKV